MKVALAAFAFNSIPDNHYCRAYCELEVKCCFFFIILLQPSTHHSAHCVYLGYKNIVGFILIKSLSNYTYFISARK